MAERRSTLVWHDIRANIHIDVRGEYEIRLEFIHRGKS